MRIRASSCNVLHLDARNDENGNPRRLYLVLSKCRILAAVNEGYDGPGALAALGGPDVGHTLSARIVGRIAITPAEYHRLRKLYSKAPTLA